MDQKEILSVLREKNRANADKSGTRVLGVFGSVATDESYVEAEDLSYFKNWFSSYVASFASDDPEISKNIDLKYGHTLRVCKEAVDIGKALGLGPSHIRLSETTALFHDVGRFEQYRKYRTFSDRKSVNHAVFGVEILRERAVLSRLAQPVQELIQNIITYHNRATLPDDESPLCLFFSRLLRDADKLDIWWVLTEYYRMKAAGETNETIELDLPDTPGISGTIYENLIRGEVILFEKMQNLNDFKLFQVGWVYDINFTPTLKCLKQRAYLSKIQAALPEIDDVRKIFETVHSYVDHRLKENA